MRESLAFRMFNPPAEFPGFQAGDECNAASGGNPQRGNGATRDIVANKIGTPDFSPGGSAKDGIKKILVLRNDGIGDFLLSLPAMQALRHSYPYAHITLFTCNWQESVAKHVRLFDEIIIWDNSCNFYLTSPTMFRYLSYRMLKFIPLLRSKKFNLGIDFKDDVRNRFIMWASAIEFRTGFKKGCADFLLTLPVRYPEWLHKSMLYSQLILPFVEPASIAPYAFVISDEDKEAADAYLKNGGVSPQEKMVVIHPVSRWQAKTWPKEKFAALSDSLLSLTGVKVVFIGAPEDEGAVNEIKDSMAKRPVIFAGRLNFLQTAAVIQRAHLFIGIDAAPMHMAGMLDIPTIGIFGPSDPKVCGPLGKKSITVRKIDAMCAGCFKKKTGTCIKPRDFCMNKISVSEVFDIAINFLH